MLLHKEDIHQIVTKKMLTKTTILYHYTPTRMTEMNKILPSVGKDGENLEPSHTTGGSVTWSTHVRKLAVSTKAETYLYPI